VITVGCDPGLDGALAFYNNDKREIIACFNLPTLSLAKGAKGTSREINEDELVSMVRGVFYATNTPGRTVGLWVIERVSSSPQMGVSSSFKFGVGYGIVRMLPIMFGIPRQYITPAKWKRDMLVPKEKDDARRRASELMPSSTSHWAIVRGEVNAQQAGGRAEAAIMAMYAQNLLAPEPAKKTKRMRL
jgi:hypothetical protein